MCKVGVSRALGKYYGYSKVVLNRVMRGDLCPDLVQIILEKVYIESRKDGTWKRFPIPGLTLVYLVRVFS